MVATYRTIKNGNLMVAVLLTSAYMLHMHQKQHMGRPVKKQLYKIQAETFFKLLSILENGTFPSHV